jgi:hypothetical protein
MTRGLISIAVAVALAVGASVAEAKVVKGTYRGKTSDGGKVALKVDKSKSLVNVTRSNLLFRCSDGDRFRSLSSTSTGKVPIADGKFDISDTQPDDAVSWQMTGSFNAKGTKIAGTYGETRRFNSKDRLDPKGSVTCQTGDLTYSARRVVKKRK